MSQDALQLCIKTLFFSWMPQMYGEIKKQENFPLTGISPVASSVCSLGREHSLGVQC